MKQLVSCWMHLIVLTGFHCKGMYLLFNINNENVHFVCLFVFLSDEDISIVKASLFLFKKISLKFSKNKDCDTLIKPIIRLSLVATLRVCSSDEILENKLSEIKERVAGSLQETLRAVTVAKTKLGTFNLHHKSQGKVEIQVRYGLSCLLLLLLFNCIFDFCSTGVKCLNCNVLML